MTVATLLRGAAVAMPPQYGTFRQAPSVAAPTAQQRTLDIHQQQRSTSTMSQQQVDYDNKGQMERIASMVITGEILYAVYDMKGGGTGFLGITDRRLIFMDQGMIRKAKTLVSLPFSQITVVASEDSGGIFSSTSKLIVIAGSREWDFEFRGADKAHRAYQLIMGNLLQNERPGIMKGV